MPSRADIYEQGWALLDRLSAELGMPIGLWEPRVHQLSQPCVLSPRAFERKGGPEHGRQRPIVVPAGWFEALCCIAGEDHMAKALCWRTWAPNYERARRKAERKVLQYAMKRHAEGTWP